MDEITFPQVNTCSHNAPKSKKMKKVKSMKKSKGQQDAQVQHDELVNSKLPDKFDMYIRGLFINYL